MTGRTDEEIAKEYFETPIRYQYAGEVVTVIDLADRIAMQAAPTLLTLHPTAEYKTIALKAYNLADAMIEERNRR